VPREILGLMGTIVINNEQGAKTSAEGRGASSHFPWGVAGSTNRETGAPLHAWQGPYLLLGSVCYSTQVHHGHARGTSVSHCPSASSYIWCLCAATALKVQGVAIMATCLIWKRLRTKHC
jgi:hypothetical protein